MVGSRTIGSLAQYLALQEVDFFLVLLAKHGIHANVERRKLLRSLVEYLESAMEQQVLALLDEIARTRGDLRTRVNPKYRYEERFQDLNRCLQLDGYSIEDDGVIRLDPSIDHVPPLDDDLTKELQESGLPEANDIIDKINSSAESFRASAPNYNACLNDIRVALQTLATTIARVWSNTHPGTYESTKWGSVIGYLKNAAFISDEEERGLAGVFGFVSPGSHKPMGISQEEMARLGRVLGLGMCWFLVKRYRGAK